MTTNTMDFETAAVSAVRSIQERTGESQIRPLVVDWRRWMTEGVIVGVHISRWRGNVSLRMEDLGMGEELADSEAQEMLLLGKKLVMVPEFKKQFDSLEVRARATIKRYGFATHWGTFVPATAYSEMKAELTALKEQYMELAARYCGEYETHISSMQEIYRRIATRAYERFMRENPAAVAGASQREWVGIYVYEVMRRIPVKEALLASFAFDWDLSYIPLPTMIAEEEAAAAGIRNAVALKREMDRDVQARAKAQKEELIDDFFAQVKAQINALVYDTCMDVIASLQGRENVHPRSIVQLNNLVENLQRLNFWGDEDVTEAIKKFRGITSGYSTRGSGEVTKILTGVLNQARETIQELGVRPENSRYLADDDALFAQVGGMGKRSTFVPAVAPDEALELVVVDERKRRVPLDDATSMPGVLTQPGADRRSMGALG